LDIKKIRNSIKDFNEDEKGTHSMGTLGGEQEQLKNQNKVIYIKYFFI
jgi:hypothetical protein